MKERANCRMEDGETVELVQTRLSSGKAHLHAVILVGRDRSAITLQDILLGTHAGSV